MLSKLHQMVMLQVSKISSGCHLCSESYSRRCKCTHPSTQYFNSFCSDWKQISIWPGGGPSSFSVMDLCFGCDFLLTVKCQELSSFSFPLVSKMVPKNIVSLLCCLPSDNCWSVWKVYCHNMHLVWPVVPVILYNHHITNNLTKFIWLVTSQTILLSFT